MQERPCHSHQDIKHNDGRRFFVIEENSPSTLIVEECGLVTVEERGLCLHLDGRPISDFFYSEPAIAHGFKLEEIELQAGFGRKVLAVLADEEDWGADELQEIVQAAVLLGLAGADEDGNFSLDPKHISPPVHISQAVPEGWHYWPLNGCYLKRDRGTILSAPALATGGGDFEGAGELNASDGTDPEFIVEAEAYLTRRNA